MSVVPFSRFVKTGSLVFTSGQIHLDENGRLLDGSIEEKTEQVMKNLSKILTEASVAFDDVVKATIYVTEMLNYERINSVYMSFFDKKFPARELVCVKELPLGADVEISMIAEIGG